MPTVMLALPAAAVAALLTVTTLPVVSRLLVPANCPTDPAEPTMTEFPALSPMVLLPPASVSDVPTVSFAPG